jgi:GWxTD domain-containing protein
MRSFAAVVVSFLVAAAALAADPGAAMSRARQALNERQYQLAVNILQDAVPDAAMLADPQRSQALAALHFYSALAFNGMRDPDKTREELEQFFRFNQKAGALDPAKFDAAFITAFNEVRSGKRVEKASNFDSIYPGWRSFAELEPKDRPLSQWGDGPELQLLGSSEEKRRWRTLRDDDERHSFVEKFWKERDKTANTEDNEFRRDFLHRVAFADYAWANERTRGSLTDRGRVFVLLGTPRVIRLKPLTVRESNDKLGGPSGIQAVGVGPGATAASFREIEADDKNMTNIAPTPIARGNVERWIFGRDQIPTTVPDAEVVFKFITQEGVGDHMLQREFMINKVLADAATMN